MVQKQKTPLLIETQLFDDEDLVWWGQPVAASVIRRIKLMDIVPNLLVIGFAIFFIIFTQDMFSDMRRPSTFSGFGRSSNMMILDTFFPFFFLLIPGIMITTAGWSATKPLRDWYAATKTYYALSNKRAIIIVDTFSTSIESYYDEQMTDLKVTQYGNTGDVLFTSKTVTRQRKSNYGNSSYTTQIPAGFYGVPDVRTVEDFIVQLFFDDDDNKRK